MIELPEVGDRLTVDTAKCLRAAKSLSAQGDIVQMTVTATRLGPVPSISVTIDETAEDVMVPWDEIAPGVV